MTDLVRESVRLVGGERRGESLSGRSPSIQTVCYMMSVDGRGSPRHICGDSLNSVGRNHSLNGRAGVVTKGDISG